MDRQLAGFFWLHWANPSTKTVEIHACIRPEFHGRWLTRRTLGVLLAYGKQIGAKNVMGLVTSEPIASIYQGLGAEFAGPFAVLQLEK